MFRINKLPSQLTEYKNGLAPYHKWEGLSYYGNLEDLKKELEMEENFGDEEWREWATAYRLLLHRGMGKISPKDLLQAVQYKTSENPDLFILYRLIHSYACYDCQEFGMLTGVLREIDETLEMMTDQHLEPFFRIRYKQILTNHKLRAFDVDAAKIGCQYIIENSNNVKYTASAYHTLGICYLYHDFVTGIENLKKSLRIYQQVGRRENMLGVRRTITFYHHYWGRQSHYHIFSNHPSDILEKIHGKIRERNVNWAKDMLERIDVQTLWESGKGFYYFYKGLAYNRVDDFYLSMACFNKNDDKFFSNLGRIELYKRNERSSAIEAAFR